MGQIADERQPEVVRHRTEREERRRRLRHARGVLVRLLEHRVARSVQPHRARIAEAAHAAERAEVVVERPVLLHQDDDVLHVLDRSGDDVGLDRQGVPDAFGKCGGHACACHPAKKCTAVNRGHSAFL